MLMKLNYKKLKNTFILILSFYNTKNLYKLACKYFEYRVYTIQK